MAHYVNIRVATNAGVEDGYSIFSMKPVYNQDDTEWFEWLGFIDKRLCRMCFPTEEARELIDQMINTVLVRTFEPEV